MREGDADGELRAVILDRLECVVRRLRPAIDQEHPDPKAVETFLKVTDLEAHLSGAYAPRRQHVDVAVNAKVEHSKLEALRILDADVEIAEIVDEHLHPTADR